MLEQPAHRRRYWLLALAATALWIATAFLAVPRVIASAYAERSLPALNAMLSGRGVHPLSDYLTYWRHLAWIGTAAVAAGWIALYIAIRWGIPRARRAVPALAAERVRLIDAVLLGAAIGGVSGVLEVGVPSVRHAFTQAPFDFWYPLQLLLTPIASGAGMVIVAIVAWGLLRKFRLHAASCVIFITVGVAVFGLTQSWRLGIHQLAGLILAAGAATAAARRAHAIGYASALRIARRTSLGVTVAVILVALLLGGGRRLAEARQLRALPQAPGGAPNIILLILDTVEARALSLYGAPRTTSPRLEEFARSGVVFDRAIASTSWTLPSHATLLTGHFPFENGAGPKSPIDSRARTLGEVLQSDGYETAGIVANTYWLQRGTGVARGLVHFEATELTVGVALQTSWLCRGLVTVWDRITHAPVLTGRKTADDVNRATLRWLSDRDASRPFFLFLNYIDAHDPYPVIPPFDSIVAGDTVLSKIQWYPYQFSPVERRALENAHEAAIAYLDNRVGQLLDSLRSRGLLENTLVVVTADHGDEFGTRDPTIVGHGRTLDMRLLRVPLIISMPGRVPADRRVTALASLRDIPSTILDVAGLPNPGIPGRSLASLWSSDGAPQPSGERSALAELVVIDDFWNQRNPADSVLVARSAIFQGDFELIRTRGGALQLFDVRDDPFLLSDLAPRVEYADTLAALREALKTSLGREAKAWSSPPD